MPLESESLQQFQDAGHVVVDAMIDPAGMATLDRAIREVCAWPEAPGCWISGEPMQGTRRVENFVPFHDGLKLLLTGGGLPETIGKLLGEPAQLVLEEIQLDQPGAGMAISAPGRTVEPIDVPMVTCLLAAEAAQPQSTVRIDDESDGWACVPLAFGAALLCDGRRASATEPLTGQGDRWVLRATYAPVSAGPLRDRCYQMRREHQLDDSETDRDDGPGLRLV